MRSFFTLTIAVLMTAGMASNAWSFAGQAGGGGGGGGGAAGGGSASGGASASGTAGTSGAAGTSPGANTGGTAGASTANTAGAGAAGAPTAAGAAGTRTNAGATGQANVGTGQTGVGANVQGNAGVSGVSRTPFFTDPGVRQQLNLNDNQFNTLNRAYQDAYGRYNQGLRGLNNLNEQQRQQRLMQLQAQFNQDFDANVNSTFTDPQLRSRYDQLSRQAMGFNAFNDPRLRQQLNLTPEQLRQLRDLASDSRRELARFRRGAGNNANTLTQEQWNQLWQNYTTQVNSILTPEQQQLWSQLTGKPYAFSPDFYMSEFNNVPEVRSGTLNPGTGVNTDTDTNLGAKPFPIEPARQSQRTTTTPQAQPSTR
jgi:hypothetical protein